MQKKAVAYIKFPKVGLGNMMLIWARGIVFAKINDLKWVASSWWGFHWGALLRRENKNRIYWDYFIESPLVDRIFYRIKIFFSSVKYDPLVSQIQTGDNSLYVFQKVAIDEDLFGQIRDNRQLVIDELYKLLHPKMKFKLSQYQPPVIGVHIRRGDFTIGGQETPLSYFVTIISTIRSIAKKQLPVTVFTDASKNELAEILTLGEIVIAEDKPDIVDILLLSKSNILLLSKSSTFSYWAAFLSNALVIRPASDWQKNIRWPEPDSGYVEFKWDNPETSYKTLHQLLTANKKFSEL